MTKELLKLYKHYIKYASGIPNFKVAQKNDTNYDITHLANKYCKAVDNNDKTKESQYLSALIIRYWHLIPYYYSERKGINITIEEIADLVVDGILRACKYRAWLNDSYLVSSVQEGAEKCINRCIYDR